MVDLVFLTQQFYIDHSQYPEILHKDDRPHVQVKININGALFCIPLRSNISHPYVLWTDKVNKYGLDFSKTVIIADINKYIDCINRPTIRQTEFNALRGKEYIIKSNLIKYINKYKKAKKNLNIPRNKLIVQYSSLQYFEKYI